MASSHDTLRSLILTYEDLPPDQKAEADAHLESCAECRRLFDQLALADREADVRVELPSGSVVAQQLARLDTGTAAGGSPAPVITVIPFDVPAPVRKLPLWALVLLPAAIVLGVILLIALFRGERRPPPIVKELRLVPYAATASAPSGWHTGQSFALELKLARPAGIVVFHVDPSGYTDLLYPDDPAAPLEVFASGDVRLPRGATRGAWRFEGGPGTESFVVAAGVTPGMSLPRVVNEVRGLPLWAGRAATVRGLQALLERRVGPCEMVEIDHLP